MTPTARTSRNFLREEVSVNIDAQELPRLRSLLSEVDEHTDTLASVRVEIARAEATASRLRAQIAEMEGQAAQIADHHIRPDGDRVASLLADDDVAQSAPKDIEARAQRGRAIAAQLVQVKHDLAAVEEHMATLVGRAQRCEQMQAEAEVALLSAMGEAEFAAYQRAARTFVETHVVPIQSLAVALANKTGENPGWWSAISGGLKIVWFDPNPAMPDYPTAVTLWPRLTGHLVSGEPSHSPEVVAALIQHLRAGARPREARSTVRSGGADRCSAATITGPALRGP